MSGLLRHALLTQALRRHMPNLGSYVENPTGRTSLRLTHDASPSAQHIVDFPLGELPCDVLFSVAKQLRDVDYKALVSLSRACKGFHQHVNRVVYYTITINRALMNAAARNPVVRNYLSQYTRHLVIRNTDVDHHGFAPLVYYCDRLDSIRWRHVWLGGPRPILVLNFFQLQSRGIKLYVENAPIIVNQVFHNYYFMAQLPPECLVSLEISKSTTAPLGGIDHLKSALVRATRLERLQFCHRGSPANFVFDDDERMPALKELALMNYNWNHSQLQVKNHWDFSRLRSLSLSSVPIFEFFSSLRPGDLADLHTLRIEEHENDWKSSSVEASQLVYKLVKDHIRALEVLEMVCHIDVFRIDAILQHKHTLRKLRLRDHVGFGDESRLCPTLTLGELALLARELRHVHTLELDLDYRISLTSQFLHIIGQFPSLRTLTLNVQTTIRPMYPYPSHIDLDPDLETARAMGRLLVSVRKQTTPDIPLRRITINVGGWEENWPRRWSPSWNAMNRSGRFAERRFHIKRENDYGDHLDYVMREELGESYFAAMGWTPMNDWHIQNWGAQSDGAMVFQGLLFPPPPPSSSFRRR